MKTLKQQVAIEIKKLRQEAKQPKKQQEEEEDLIMSLYEPINDSTLNTYHSTKRSPK